MPVTSTTDRLTLGGGVERVLESPAHAVPQLGVGAASDGDACIARRARHALKKIFTRARKTWRRLVRPARAVPTLRQRRGRADLLSDRGAHVARRTRHSPDAASN